VSKYSLTLVLGGNFSKELHLIFNRASVRVGEEDNDVALSLGGTAENLLVKLLSQRIAVGKNEFQSGFSFNGLFITSNIRARINNN